VIPVLDLRHRATVRPFRPVAAPVVVVAPSTTHPTSSCREAGGGWCCGSSSSSVLSPVSSCSPPGCRGWSHSISPALSHPHPPRKQLLAAVVGVRCRRCRCPTHDPPYEQWLIGLGRVPSRCHHWWCWWDPLPLSSALLPAGHGGGMSTSP
jgi:hypothetical protein